MIPGFCPSSGSRVGCRELKLGWGLGAWTPGFYSWLSLHVTLQRALPRCWRGRGRGSSARIAKGKKEIMK